MKLRCCCVDRDGRLWRMPVEAARRVWRGQESVWQNGWAVDEEFRLLTMVCDERLRPRLTYFFRLRLENGWSTDATRAAAAEAVAAGNIPDLCHPAVRRQFDPEAWPADLRRQVAVALDIPAADIRDNVGVGGPLPLADLHGLPLRRFMEGYAEAFE